MQMLSFTTDDGFSYERVGDIVKVRNSLGGYEQSPEHGFYYSVDNIDAEGQLKLYARIDEILRIANKFKRILSYEFQTNRNES